MRLIFYKIIYPIIRLDQHCPLQNNILLMQHIWPSEFSMPHSRIGSQLLLVSCWPRLQPSERCQVFESDSPWFSILILGTSENHKATDLENEESVETREWNFSPEIHELTRPMCAGAFSWWRIQSSLQFPFEFTSSSFSDGPGLQNNIFHSLWHKVGRKISNSSIKCARINLISNLVNRCKWRTTYPLFTYT
jgi:hypothetical protein